LTSVDEDEEGEEDDDDCVLVDGVKKPRTPFQLFMVDAREQANAELKLKPRTPGKRKAANDLMRTWFDSLPAADKARYEALAAADRRMIPKQFPAGAAFKLPNTSRTTASTGSSKGKEAKSPAARGPATLPPAATAHRAGKGKEPAGDAARGKATGGKPPGKQSELSVVGEALQEWTHDVTSFLGFRREKMQGQQQETDESVSVEDLVKCVDAYFITWCRYWDRVWLMQGLNMRDMHPDNQATMMVNQLLLRLERFTGDCPIECLVENTWSRMVLTAGDVRYLLHEEQRETLLKAAREKFAEFAETTPVDHEELMRFHDASMSSGWRLGPSD
jgi:hypothetical protein